MYKQRDPSFFLSSIGDYHLKTHPHIAARKTTRGEVKTRAREAAITRTARSLVRPSHE